MRMVTTVMMQVTIEFAIVVKVLLVLQAFYELIVYYTANGMLCHTY